MEELDDSLSNYENSQSSYLRLCVFCRGRRRVARPPRHCWLPRPPAAAAAAPSAPVCAASDAPGTPTW